MDPILFVKAIGLIVALVVAFACFMAGVLLAINGAMGNGFMGQRGRLLKFLLPAIAVGFGLVIAALATAWFMRSLPR